MQHNNPISDILLPISYFLFPISYILYPISYPLHSITYLRIQFFVSFHIFVPFLHGRQLATFLQSLILNGTVRILTLNKCPFEAVVPCQ